MEISLRLEDVVWVKLTEYGKSQLKLIKEVHGERKRKDTFPYMDENGYCELTFKELLSYFHHTSMEGRLGVLPYFEDSKVFLVDPRKK